VSRAGLAGRASLAGHTGLPAVQGHWAGPVARWKLIRVSNLFCFYSFFTDLMIDSKFHISRMVDPNDVVLILWWS
jgi:hypothetical protein